MIDLVQEIRMYVMYWIPIFLETSIQKKSGQGVLNIMPNHPSTLECPTKRRKQAKFARDDNNNNQIITKTSTWLCNDGCCYANRDYALLCPFTALVIVDRAVDLWSRSMWVCVWVLHHCVAHHKIMIIISFWIEFEFWCQNQV